MKETSNEKRLWEFRRFLVVTDALAAGIESGQIRRGCHFLSRADICSQFGISLVTAHKVQKGLESRGLISSRNGRSFMVCDPKNLGKVPLRLIRLLRQVPTDDVDPVMDAISGGARRCCEKNGIEFQEQFVELLSRDSRKLNAVGDCSEGEGVILHPYKEMMLRAASYFLKYWFHRVTIDNPLPDTPGILVDSLDGLLHLFSAARDRGVKTMMLIPCAAHWQVSYISERLHLAQWLCSQYGITLNVQLAGNFDIIAEEISRNVPDAIMLLYDDCFELIRQALLDRIGQLPQIYLFARNMVPRLDCIAYATDYHQLGEAAVEELIVPRTAGSRIFLRYVCGKLVLPDAMQKCAKSASHAKEVPVSNSNRNRKRRA